MNVKARIEKLEAEHAKKVESGLLVLTVKHGESDKNVLQSWLEETGKPAPSLVVFIKRFSCT